MTATSAFSVFGMEPFPTIVEGDSITDAILTVLHNQDQSLLDGDIIVVASKAVSISEKRYVDLAAVAPSPQAREISAQTGKPAAIVQLILNASFRKIVGHGPGRPGAGLSVTGLSRAGPPYVK